MIDIRDVGDISVVQLAHGKVNALDVELLDALTESLTRLASTSGSALVLTGEGTAFSAGVDLFRVLEDGAAYTAQLIPALSRTFQALFAFPRPVVAAINGAAIAGGCVLACACDWRVMSDTGASIGASELLVGVPFPSAALEILRYASGDHAEEVILTAKLYAGEEARTVGLVHEYVAKSDLLDRAVAVAGELSRLAPDGYRLAKQLLRKAAVARMVAASANDDEVQRVWASDATANAIRAHLEKTVVRRS